MTESRKASDTRRSESAVAKAIRTLVDRASRVLEALAPQPQLQPIPVRARRGRPMPRG